MGIIYCQPQKKTKRRRKRFPDPSIIYIGQSNMISIPTYMTNPSGHRHPPRRKTPNLISRCSLLSHQPLRHIPRVGVAAPVTVESRSNTISHSHVESRSNTFSCAEITRNLLVSAGNQLLRTKYILVGRTTGEKRYRLKYVPSTTTLFNWRSAFLGIGLQPLLLMASRVLQVALTTCTLSYLWTRMVIIWTYQIIHPDNPIIPKTKLILRRMERTDATACRHVPVLSGKHLPWIPGSYCAPTCKLWLYPVALMYYMRIS
ncbi:hypothetical protein BS47DRAFT_1402639 [Hydnum rufescens UP504]|uniref:Uncharacterized protein n=1 Tax=Hydnum rufescens UP504 TaxID=1448309 RepID=A0A9P6ABZ9_9AGAM|nr:hypothetical protein BS47DRAFT_1402639 [Hydnum rufescens UP504]